METNRTMKPKQKRKSRAFTRVELMVVAAVITILAGMLLPVLAQSKQKSQRLMCVNNLQTLGVAYRVWADGHGGLNPAMVTTANGGWADLSANGLTGPQDSGSCGPSAFTNYEIMQNQLGQSPKVVLCPSDERIANTNFNDPNWTVPGTFANTNCSYWVGVGAGAAYPGSLVGGDRNLGGLAQRIANAPYPLVIINAQQDPNYGMSPLPGATGGAETDLTTNSEILRGANGQTGYVQWSAKMHSAGDPTGEGNILLGDGGVQQVNSYSFRTNWLVNATDYGNYGAFPVQRGSIRLVFP